MSAKECSVDQCKKPPARYRPMCDMHITRLKRTGTTNPPKNARGPLLDRYWRKVIKGEPGHCWGWDGTTNDKGYGQIRDNGGTGAPLHYIHRLSYAIHHGPIPDGLEVLHSCDNPPCSNPEHLSVGTHLDNMTDAKNKGRMGMKARK